MNNKIISKEFDYSGFESEVLDSLKEGKPLTGKDGEMESHLSDAGDEYSNRRNGRLSKVVKSSQGSFELSTPRDRNGTFEPQLVRKRQTILNESLDQKVLALYSVGMSYSDISEHLAEMYGIEVSSATNR